MMPEGAADGRSEQLATLKGIAHELLTAPDMASRWLRRVKTCMNSTIGNAPICVRCAGCTTGQSEAADFAGFISGSTP